MRAQALGVGDPADSLFAGLAPTEFFDRVLAEATSGGLDEALGKLIETLAHVRRKLSAEDWHRFLDLARGHSLCDWLHRDPFTLRCYSKPRGHAGDALALDYVLRAREVPARAKQRDPLASVHHYTTQGALARALRYRRDHIARMVDEAAARSLAPIRVFAAGAGHLRELDCMKCVGQGRIAKLVAFDHDAECLETIRREYGHVPIETHPGSIRQLIEGKHLFGDQDFVYCAGLMETLPQAAAQGLTRALFALLRPGGTLLIANLRSHLPDAGYLEAYMDWRMVLRTEAEIYDLLRPLESEAVSGWFYSENSESTIGFVSVQRR